MNEHDVHVLAALRAAPGYAREQTIERRVDATGHYLTTDEVRASLERLSDLRLVDRQWFIEDLWRALPIRRSVAA